MQMKERGSERIEYLSAGEEAHNAPIDVSATGAAFIHPTAAKKDSLISVKIKTFTLEANVVYCQPRSKGFRIGLYFTHVPAEVQKKLTLLVEEFSRGVPLTCEIIQGENKKE
jgi:hypothetical protein